MRLKPSHKTNPEVVWRRPDLDVYRAATRRRKDVRVSSKYLKISSRNAGDPLLIKTAGSTCAFPGLLRNPLRVYLLSSSPSSYPPLPPGSAHGIFPRLVIIFREQLSAHTIHHCCHRIIGPAASFFFFPFSKIPQLMESRESTLSRPIRSKFFVCDREVETAYDLNVE